MVLFIHWWFGIEDKPVSYLYGKKGHKKDISLRHQRFSEWNTLAEEL